MAVVPFTVRSAFCAVDILHFLSKCTQVLHWAISYGDLMKNKLSPSSHILAENPECAYVIPSLLYCTVNNWNRKFCNIFSSF